MVQKPTRVIEVQPHDDDTWFYKNTQFRLFLAGTIDMGNSEDWQDKFVKSISQMKHPYGKNPDYFVLYNPRRDEHFGDDPKEFEYQVNWELDHLEACDRIVMCILGTSKSPISLMELGLFARTIKLHVICEPNFYRHENVRIVCERYQIPLYDSLDEYLKSIDHTEEEFQNG